MAFQREMRMPNLVAEDALEWPSKVSRTSSGLGHTDKANALTIELAAATNTALRSVPETDARVTLLCALLQRGVGANEEDDHSAALAAASACAWMCFRQANAAHTLVVADALQLLLRGRLVDARGTTL